MLELLIAGFLIGLTHAMPPGPITIEVLRRGAAEGLIPALKVDAGSVVADTIFFLLVLVGLMQVINGREGRLLVWAIGCVLLLVLGIAGLYRARATRPGKPGSRAGAGDARKKAWPPFLTGFFICITSPFAIVWWASVFAGSTALFNPDYTTMITIFVGIAIAVLVWYATIGISGVVGGKLVSDRAINALSTMCSLMMIGFAVLMFYRGYTTLL